MQEMGLGTRLISMHTTMHNIMHNSSYMTLIGARDVWSSAM